MMHNEQSLIFRLDPQQCDKPEHIACFHQASCQTREFASTFYDTRDFALLQDNIALHTQFQTSHHQQCLTITQKKRAPQVFCAAIATAQLDFTKLYTSPIASRIINGAFRASIAPIFTLRGVMHTVTITLNAHTQVHVTLRSGTLAMDAQSNPFQEIKIDCIHGRMREFYDFALTLLAELPGNRTHYAMEQRCLHTLKAQPAMVQKPTAFKLQPDMSTETALQMILTHIFEDFYANEAAVLKGEDIEGVHQMRVSLRRFRACLNLFRAVIPKPTLLEMVTEIKWLGETLGPARDLDVFLFSSVATLHAQLPSNLDLLTLKKRFTEKRNEAYQNLHRDIHSVRFTQLVLILQRWIAAKAWRAQRTKKQKKLSQQPIKDFARHVIAKRMAVLTEKGAHFATLSDDQRHALRIDIKKLRYAGQFFCELFPHPETTRQIKLMGKMQDTLGDLNDAVVAQKLLTGIGYTDEQPALNLFRGWYACLNRDNRACSIDLWTQLHQHTPFWTQSS